MWSKKIFIFNTAVSLCQPYSHFSTVDGANIHFKYGACGAHCGKSGFQGETWLG